MLEWDGSKTYASWDSNSAEKVSDFTLLDAAAATEYSESAAGGNSTAVTISVASGLCIVALGIYAMRCGKKTVGDDFMRA